VLIFRAYMCFLLSTKGVLGISIARVICCNFICPSLVYVQNLVLNTLARESLRALERKVFMIRQSVGMTMNSYSDVNAKYKS
jgi:hypothetical protein